MEPHRGGAVHVAGRCEPVDWGGDWGAAQGEAEGWEVPSRLLGGVSAGDLGLESRRDDPQPENHLPRGARSARTRRRCR